MSVAAARYGKILRRATARCTDLSILLAMRPAAGGGSGHRGVSRTVSRLNASTPSPVKAAKTRIDHGCRKAGVGPHATTSRYSPPTIA